MGGQGTGGERDGWGQIRRALNASLSKGRYKLIFSF